MPTVSVVIPTYNRAPMLREAIQSVLDQTYSEHEIIVVDDGSTDNTREVVNKFSDKRVRYVFQENRGRSNARNHGISLAQGRYIAFLDSDDVFVPAKLEKQVSCMEKNPGVLLSHTSYLRIDANEEYIKEVTSGTFSGKVYPNIMRWCPIATPTVMILREALGESLRFEESIHIGEDIILWAQLAKKSPFIGITEPLTKVRMHRNNAAFDPHAQITGLTNIVEFAIRLDPDLHFITRHRLLSDVYLAIGWNYFLANEKARSLKFLMLALLNQPLNPPIALICKLSTMFHSGSINRCR
jgi:glycosyltransferase involved in cell wall biosynthesis